MTEPDVVSGFDEGTFSYDEPEDLMRDVRNYTSRLDFDRSSSEHRPSDDEEVRLLLEQLDGVTARDLRTVSVPAPAPLPDSSPSPVSEPVGNVPETAPSSAPTPAAAGPSGRGRGRSSARGRAKSTLSRTLRSDSKQPSSRTLNELKKLAYFAKGEFPDVAHKDEVFCFVEYAYATHSSQLRSLSAEGTVKVPDSYKEAMQLPEAALWKEAMKKEMKSLDDLKVYNLVPKTDVPQGQNVIGSKWVFKVKADTTYKARIVAQGWNQIPGRDCGNTYAPVCRLQSIRMVLAIAAEYDLEVHQMDVKTAFLYADLLHKVFVKQAPGFEITRDDGVQLVMKLNKSLYGLAQSPLNWWNTIDPKLVEIGFEPLKSDPCVYLYNHKNTVVIITL